MTRHLLPRARPPDLDRGLGGARNGHALPDGPDPHPDMQPTPTMALQHTPNAEIEEWAGSIATALLEQLAWYRQALTHQEIRSLTGLSEHEVSRGCWHARLHGLLQFERGTGQFRYALTPLGAALARRIRSQRANSTPDS